MADSGQRLLDVIDDANALESFLGTLTSDDTSGDNEVELESLARSLAAAAEFGVDSPNETLFEPLEPSGNLTDISQSNVPFDFGPVTTNTNDTNVFSSSQDSYSLSNDPNGGTQLHHDFSSSITSNSIDCDSTASYSNTTSTLRFSSDNSSLVFSSNSQQQQVTSMSNGGTGTNNESSSMQQQQQEQQLHYTSSHLSSSSLSSHNLNTISTTSTTSETSASSSSSSSAPNPQSISVSNNVVNSTINIQTNFQQQAQQQQIQITTAAQPEHQQQQQQTTTTQYASLGQLVQAQQQNQQATILTGMNNQLIATSTASGLPHAGIIIDQNGQPMMVATGGNGGFSNVSLIAGMHHHQPTYAVLPSSTSLFGNTITMQPQTIQTLKTTNGTQFLQAASAAQTLVTHTQQNPIVSTAGQNIRPKQPPQLLPKPSNSGPNNSNTTIKTVQAGSSGGETTTTTVSNSGLTVTTTSMENLSQMIQQSNNSQAVSFAQPSFAIGAGGQVVQVSGVSGVNTMSGPQTIVFNQFGQQMLVPAAAVGHSGVQFILRQQPAPTQVLAIQAPTNTTHHQATATVGGKPVVRLMSHSVQQTRPQGQQIQLQQIQTANGPAWVLANTMSVTTAPQAQIQSQIVSVPTITQQSNVVKTMPTITQTQPVQQVQVQQAPTPQQQPAPRPPPPPAPTPPPPRAPTPKTDTINDSISSVIARLGRSPSPEPQPKDSTTNPTQPSTKYSSKSNSKSPSHSDSSNTNGPPPKKKSKPSKSKKKVVVALDLGQLLKQSGIMDEDLQDDDMMGFGDFFSSSSDPITSVQETTPAPVTPAPAVPQQNGYYNSTPTNNNTYKPNGVTTLPHTHVLKPSSKTKQKKPAGLNKLLNSMGSDSVPASPVIAIKTPPKSKSKKKAQTPATPLPPPPPPVPTPPTKATPKGKGKGKKGAASIAAAEMVNTVSSTTNPIPTTPSTPKTTKGKGKKNANRHRPESPTVTSTGSPVVSATTTIKQEPSSTPANVIQTPTGPATTVGTPTISPSQTRIVQTIQLTPQNQQLLRNIQTQIQRLVALPTRNEIEQTSLQKLIILQQQVISTGTPVPNPPSVQTLSGTQVQKPGVTVLKGPITPNAATTTPTIVTSTPLMFTTNNASVQFAKLIPNTTSTTTTTNSNISQPPPLILNNSAAGTSCTGKKIIITSNQPSQIGSNTTSLSNNNHATDSQQVLLVPKLEPTEEKVTSSSINSIQTTTLSTSINSNSNSNSITCVGGGGGGGNGFYTHVVGSSVSVLPEHDIIDEKKLEEQLIARLKAEEEARIKWRKDEFDKRLENDHKFFLNPEYQSPYKSFDDVTERLMHYHVAIDKNQMDFEEFDDDFAETSSVLLEKFHGMTAKYRALLLKESMREVICAERVMLDRIFVGEERLKLDHDKNLVAQGEILDLPPPPADWIPKINDMVEEEMKDMERDSVVNQQVQSAIDSIITFGNNDGTNYASVDEGEKIEYDAFGVPISSSNYNNMNSSSAAIDEAVRSILI